jgi:ABC-type transporter MlaC component
MNTYERASTLLGDAQKPCADFETNVLIRTDCILPEQSWRNMIDCSQVAPCLPVLLAMKHNKSKLTAVALVAIVSIGLPGSFLPVTAIAAKAHTEQAATQAVVTPEQKHLLTAFNNHVKDYLKQRERVRKKLTKLSKEATPEQIQAYQKSFVEALTAMRTGTKPGYIFTPEVADYFRKLIKTEFKGSERAEVRQTILEAETKGVPLKINYPYPDTKEITQMPPTLLLKLPLLPKEVRYRFVRQHLLLVDTDNDLIVDYMLNALP